MNRRELLIGGLALAGAALTGRVQAASLHEHAHHHDASPYAALAAAAADCVGKGEICLNHCLELLAQGDKEMAACAQSVNQMLAVCTALRQLSNQNSSYTAKFAAIAADVCKRCEDECLKHAKKHIQCKACAESCSACHLECQKVNA
ncbi:MAG: four-helix bundle copper-binding protein [Gallionella sp.]|nr:four-helix bundle copper-binding protein [Gallionella sp.]